MNQESNISKLNIKDLALEDRPREKLLLKGLHAVSDAELLAILIGSGNRDETAVELCQRILHSVSNNLNTLGKLSVKDLTRSFRGIGEAKALTIIAALELGRRRNQSTALELPKISCSKDVFNIMQPIMGDLSQEEIWVLLMNNSSKVLKKVAINTGGVGNTNVDIRSIIKEALDNSATAIILCHNHPAGTLSPSEEDNAMTEKVKNACKTMSINLLDHIIITDTNYYSYLDEQKL